MSLEIELPETPETPESHKERTVGLIIACIAVVLAIVSHLSNEIHQEEILAHVDATDQYGYYQAKKTLRTQLQLQSESIKLNHDNLSATAKTEADKLLAGYSEDIERYAKESEGIKDTADEHVAESARLSRKASVLDIGEIALQIAIVLCSITILTEQGLFARLGMIVALAGAAIAAWAILFTH